jgi:hypothetical protein
MKHYVEDTCEVICEDNGRKVVGDILAFNERRNLTVSINKSIKLMMSWNGRIYEGKMSGMSFVSDGPIIRSVKEGR